jgi:small subunit ribosomal protein S15
MLTIEKKREIIEKHKTHPGDTGSPEVQIALLTERVNNLSKHLIANKHDFISRLGLLRLVGERHRMLAYLRGVDEKRYLRLIESLGLRK